MKKAMSILLVLMLLLTTGGAFASSPTDEEPFVLAYCAKNLANTWQQQMVTAFTELQEKYNYTFVHADAAGAPETQLTQIQNYLTQGVDAICMIVSDEGISSASAALCKDAGVPLICEAITMKDEDGNLVCPSVETNAVTFGTMCSDWFFDNYQSIGFDISDPSKVGFITVTNGAVQSMVNRCKAAEDEFIVKFPDFPTANIFVADVAGDTASYNEAAYNQVSAILTANANIGAWIVIGGGDDYAQGACRALEAAGVDEKSCLISMGGELACDEWADGLTKCWYAACYFSAYECAEMVVQGFVEVIRNGKTTDQLYPEFKKEGQTFAAANFSAQMVTPDNYRDIMWEALLNK